MSSELNLFELIKKSANSAPYWNLLDMRVQDAKEGWSRCVMTTGPKHLISRGNVHGGAIASLADSAVAIALIPMLDQHHFVTTVELKINYLAPASQGEMVAEARIIHKGSRIAVGDVDVTSNGKLVAKCLATYMILPKRS